MFSFEESGTYLMILGPKKWNVSSIKIVSPSNTMSVVKYKPKGKATEVLMESTKINIAFMN